MKFHQQGLIRSGAIILLLIVVAVIILFLLPTPNSGKLAEAAVTRAATIPSDCLETPANFNSPAVLASTAPASLWKAWTYNSSITLSATPKAALVDQPVTIRVSGLTSGEPVTLHASMRDYQHRTWSTEATFLADHNGVVNVTRDAPRYGGYSGVHAMGLVWSMLPENVKNPAETLYAPPATTTGYPLTLEALANQKVLARVTLTRYLQAPGVTKTEVATQGLVGELYTPATEGSHPAIVLIGGSEGGLYPQVNEAALFASQGYVALGLAYFQGFSAAGDPRLKLLPKMLANIPLEYFVKAADWLKKQPGVDPHHVAIMGWSKGAEAALITAASFPQEFQAVITFMPSSVVWSGIEYGPGPISSSWTIKGKPLPWINPVMNASMFGNGKPLAFVDAYQAGLKDTAAVGKAAIPVEHIAGPVLLISAGDDQIWPSPHMSEQIMRRLLAHHHDYADESLCYADAGHAILPPYRPASASMVAVPGGSFAFGGTTTAYAFADRDAWKHVLAFLHKALY